MTTLDELLELLVERDGSDLHLRAGEPPLLRVHGCLRRTDRPALSAEDTRRLVAGLLNDERRARFARQRDLELSYATGETRFRVSVFRQQGQVGAVFRLVPTYIRTIDELMLPVVTRDLLAHPSGLLLVTGPLRSGKSTTLAALIDFINTTRAAHVITIEDPIEFVHADQLAAIDQRELGQDAHSFASALRAAVRKNPDVIVVGEMPDAATVHLALAAAESGHLVLSTLHTADAVGAIDRLIEMWPPEEQRQARTRLAGALIGIISQTLLPRLDMPGRVAAFEALVTTPAVRGLIRDGKTAQIPADIQTGGAHGMEPLDASLLSLVRRKMVRYEDALARSTHPREFEQRAGPYAALQRRP